MLCPYWRHERIQHNNNNNNNNNNNINNNNNNNNNKFIYIPCIKKLTKVITSKVYINN